MKQKISDLLYLCTPFACFDLTIVDDINPTVEVTHYTPFVPVSLLQTLLGDSVTIKHKKSFYNFENSTAGTVVDGTVAGCLVAFKEFITANLQDHVSPSDLDFEVSLSSNGDVVTTSPIVTAMQDSSMLPKTIFSIMDLLTYRVPVYQALEKVSKGYTTFVQPDFYHVFLETSLGTFERRELFGSYSIKSDALQGFVISHVGDRPNLN